MPRIDRPDETPERQSSSCGHHLYALTCALAPDAEIARSGSMPFVRRTRRYDPCGSAIFVLSKPIVTEGAKARSWRACLAIARALGASRMATIFLRTGLPPATGEDRAIDASGVVPDGAGPVGHESDAWLGRAFTDRRARVICAWGEDGRRFGRDRDALAIARSRDATLYCLGRTPRGAPIPPHSLAASSWQAPELEILPTGWSAD